MQAFGDTLLKSRTNRMLFLVLLLSGSYALYLFGQNIAPKGGHKVDIAKKWDHEPTAGEHGSADVIDSEDLQLAAEHGHHQHGQMLDFLFGGLNPDSPTAVVGVHINSMPDNWLPYESTLRTLQNLGPWIVPVVFTQEDEVATAVKHLGVLTETNFKLSQGSHALVGELVSRLKQVEPHALFYGLVKPTLLLHSDVVPALNAIANMQAEKKLKPQAVVVGRSVLPEKKLNLAAVGKALHGDPALFHLALHKLAHGGRLEPDTEHDYMWFSRSAWDWQAAPPIVHGLPGDTHFLLDAAFNSGFDVVDLSTTVVAMRQLAPAAVSAEDAAINAKVWGDHPPHRTSTLDAPWRAFVNHKSLRSGTPTVVIEKKPPVQAVAPASPADLAAATDRKHTGPEINPSVPSSLHPTPEQHSQVELPPTAAGAGEGDHAGHEHLHHEVDLVDAPTEEVETVVTMFTTPFGAPVGSQKYYIQQNAIRALQYLDGVEVVVFSDDKKVEQMAAPLGVEVVTKVEANPHGTPFLAPMFKHVEHHKGSRMFGYMNADILFCTELVTTLKAVIAAVDSGKLKKYVLVVGRRTNVQLPKNLDHNHGAMVTNPDELDSKVKALAAKGKLFQADAEDFFIITPGTFEWKKIPDFVVGRPGYDNWLVDYGYHNARRMDTIDVTKTVHAIHQTGVDGNKAGHIKRVDKKWNISRGKGQYDHGRVFNCNHETRFKGKAVVLHKRR